MHANKPLISLAVEYAYLRAKFGQKPLSRSFSIIIQKKKGGVGIASGILQRKKEKKIEIKVLKSFPVTKLF